MESRVLQLAKKREVHAANGSSLEDQVWTNVMTERE